MQMITKAKDFINDWLNYTRVYILHFYDCSLTMRHAKRSYLPSAYFDEVSKAVAWCARVTNALNATAELL